MQLASLSGRLLTLCGAVLVLILAPNLPAQELPAEGKKALDEEYYKHRNTIRGLNAGTIDAANEPQAVAAPAKTHVYRYTWPEARDAGKALQYYREFAGDLDQIVKNQPKTANLLKELTKQIVATADEMFSNREPLARVNYAHVLALLASAAGEDVLDPLTKALKDEQQNDGAKYWVIQGMREVFNRGHQVPPVYAKNTKREADAILALIAFIERKPTISSGLLPEEVEGIRVLRREAIKALALTRYPAVLDAQKAVAGRTAEVLMKVIAKEGFVPEVKVDEQVEAALGLCRMQCGLYQDYQPDAAARFVGLAVVELANAYSTDGGKEHGWKIKAARFSEALAVLRADVESKKNKQHLNPASVKYVQEMLKDAELLVRGVENKGSAVPANFNNWLRGNPPPSEQVYKGLADSVVKFPEGGNN